ncbi:ABC transporter ATP-binding protein [Thermocoleostomius sinensis]|uniref:ABC transporter ATP-binding protein n=1 Tax=Thermocoleostomius sinensis TaxID=3065396 RepID=UPI0028F3F2FA|nr:ABC transporter ATP-binding protein [Thermocoleostomius sinensis]
MAQVVLENVYKSFPRRPGSRSVRPATTDLTELEATAAGVNVLRRINLTIQDGEFMVLVGPSGCGKSTLLRLIAGLETLTGGNIWVGDRLINDLPPKQRDIAMVFQSYALYPHMTVYDNLAFGLRRSAELAEDGEGERWTERNRTQSKLQTRSTERSRSSNSKITALPHASLLTRTLLWFDRPNAPKWLHNRLAQERSIARRVQTVAEMLQIESLLDRLPKQLSGGQKQRVALGRAMARDPQVFLMDEPLSNLDAKLRTETRTQIVNLQRKLGITTIYVTHDQIEAMTMGDRIAVMNAGQIQQVARPLELYNHPANRFVAEFIGSPPMNFIPVQVKAPLLIQHAQFRLTLPESWEAALRPYDGRSVTLGIRPEHLSVSLPAPKNIPVRVERVEALGSETYLSVQIAETLSGSPPLQVRIESERPTSIGESLWLSIAPDKIHLFEPDTGEAISQNSMRLL